ncbi:hypothetical protein GQX74_013076 [Glossina fuscipes]|nr:hypothetical protein GQX74_013076 [Glossina fuscipes]
MSYDNFSQNTALAHAAVSHTASIQKNILYNVLKKYINFLEPSTTVSITDTSLHSSSYYVLYMYCNDVFKEIFVGVAIWGWGNLLIIIKMFFGGVCGKSDSVKGDWTVGVLDLSLRL